MSTSFPATFAVPGDEVGLVKPEVRLYVGTFENGVCWTCALKKRGQVFMRVGLLVDLYSVPRVPVSSQISFDYKPGLSIVLFHLASQISYVVFYHAPCSVLHDYFVVLDKFNTFILF